MRDKKLINIKFQSYAIDGKALGLHVQSQCVYICIIKEKRYAHEQKQESTKSCKSTFVDESM